MRPSILDDPAKRVARVVGAVVVLIFAAVVVSAQGGDDTPSGQRPQSNVVVEPAVPTATPRIAAAAPTPAAQADRTNCDAIAGTSYRSDAERIWFQTNCSGPATATPAGPTPTRTVTTASTSPTAVSTVLATPAATAAVATPTPAPATVAAAAPFDPAAPAVLPPPAPLTPLSRIQPAAIAPGPQVPIGDRLVIPAVGINAEVWQATVPAEAAMPDPQGYFNAIWYDFTALNAWGSFGGYVDVGNLVLSGHVDCGHCYNGGSGIAVFWHTRELVPGDTAQYITASGVVGNYVVTASQSYSNDINLVPFLASSAADMTIITCTGTFASGDYNLRHIVSLRKS